MTTVSSIVQHKVTKVILTLYVITYLLIWAVSSPIAKHYIKPILADHNLQLNDDSSLRFNPFLMRVTVKDLQISQLSHKDAEKVFAIDELIIQASLWQLIFDKVVISQFTLTDGYLSLIKDQTKLSVAGVTLPEGQEETTEPTVEYEQTTAPSPYQLVLPEFLISQFHIDIKNDNKAHKVVLKELHLTNIFASEEQQQGQLLLNALLDETSFTVNLDANLIAKQGDINSTVSLNNYPVNRLARYAEQLTALDGKLSLNSEQTLTFNNDGIDLHIKKTDIVNKDLVVGLAKQKITLAKFKQNLTDLKFTLVDGKLTQLNGAGSIHFNEAKVLSTKHEELILNFTELALNDIGFHLEDEPTVKVAELLLNKLTFSQKQLDNPIELADDLLNVLPPVAHLQQLKISDIILTEKNLAIDNITLDSLMADIIIDKEKNIVNLVALTDKDKPEEQAVKEQAPQASNEEGEALAAQPINQEIQPDSNAFTFSLNSFNAINKNEIILADYSVDPIYKRTLFIDTLTLGALDNSEAGQQQQTPFTFVGRSNKYATINLMGFIQPFATAATYHVEGDLKEFSLPAISSYMKESTGIEVKTGQLNTGLNITLTGEELDGNVVVLLQGLETGLVDSDEAGSLIDQGALPLNMAMGMLKDSDGNVELDVPVSGSTSDPSFGLHSIITLITQKAIISATQDYLMTTFVPYANIVSVAVSAGQFALKLRFDDLPYEVKQIEPNDKQQAYLKEFIALMLDKDDARVSICAVSTPEDIGLPSGVEVTDKSHIKRLKTLGEQRENALKDYLIEQGKINSSRILLCKPQIDSSEGALPRIAISV